MNLGNMLEMVFASNEFQVVIKLIIITMLSCVIGHEREIKSKPAGFRTHALVGISACLVMICGIGISEDYGNNDPSRMPAQLLSGIGFVGAGTILRDGFTVTGLTTAASLLAVTCIGLCVGEGLYIEAVIGTIVVYIMLTYSYRIFNRNGHLELHSFKINMFDPKDHTKDLVKVFNNYKLDIVKMKVVDDEDTTDAGFALVEFRVNSNDFDKNKLFTELLEIDKVKDVIEV